MNGLPNTGLGMMPGMLGVGMAGISTPMPTTMDELAAAMAAGTLPGMQRLPGQAHPLIPGIPQIGQVAPAAAPAVTPGLISEERMAALVGEAIGKHMPGIFAILQQFDDVFKRALTSKDYEEFLAYTRAGSPGFDKILQSDKLFPLAQLLWDEIKENKQ